MWLSPIHGQDVENAQILFDEAKGYISDGDYDSALAIYDEILTTFPDNTSTLKMKGIALSNLGQQENIKEHHMSSLKQFYKILQKNPSDVLALTGMGLGLGNLGEYQEAKKYFEKASLIKPNNTVIQNYIVFADSVISKYPYIPTEKTYDKNLENAVEIPSWIKPIAKWWSIGQIDDSEFLNAMKFLITAHVIKIPHIDSEPQAFEKIPDWIKDRASWWADNQIDSKDFASGIQYLIEKGILVADVEIDYDAIQKQNELEYVNFEKYLKQISNNILKEKRYIEFPNPSADVIKKFLRDYIKWNFEQEAKSASEKFPNPTYQIVNGTYVIHYKVFVNEQPSGLPLDHVGTFNNSLEFWKKQDLNVNNQKAIMDFSYTTKKTEANIWVTWVVRDLGDGVLGHAHLGKGIVEVALGDYSCDGSFQLYDVNTVEQIMTHELGHSIGLAHVTEPENIMYASMKPNYAYCLLN